MGEAADAILDGLLCDVCGQLIDGQSPGYPRACSACEVYIRALDKDEDEVT